PDRRFRRTFRPAGAQLVIGRRGHPGINAGCRGCGVVGLIGTLRGAARLGPIRTRRGLGGGVATALPFWLPIGCGCSAQRAGSPARQGVENPPRVGDQIFRAAREAAAPRSRADTGIAPPGRRRLRPARAIAVRISRIFIMAGTAAAKDRTMAVKTKRPVPEKRAAAKAKPQPTKDEAPEKEAPESTPDSPLLDLSDAAVRKMIKNAKKRGYVTYERLNAVMHSEEVTSEQIEDTLGMLNEMGINVIEWEESEQEESEEPRAEEPEEEEPDGELVEVVRATPAKPEKTEPAERTDDP